MAFHDPPPEQKIRKISPPIVVLSILAILFVVLAAQSKSESSRNQATSDGREMAADRGSTRDQTIVPRVDRTLSETERKNWEAAPDSYGFSDDDRAFAAEHGIHESELRAAETILRENGIE